MFYYAIVHKWTCLHYSLKTQKAPKSTRVKYLHTRFDRTQQFTFPNNFLAMCYFPSEEDFHVQNSWISGFSIFSFRTGSSYKLCSTRKSVPTCRCLLVSYLLPNISLWSWLITLCWRSYPRELRRPVQTKALEST